MGLVPKSAAILVRLYSRVPAGPCQDPCESLIEARVDLRKKGPYTHLRLSTQNGCTPSFRAWGAPHAALRHDRRRPGKGRPPRALRAVNQLR